MNIVKLRDRLTQIIEDNKNRGWDERNNSDVVIKIRTSEITTEDKPFWRNGNNKQS